MFIMPSLYGRTFNISKSKSIGKRVLSSSYSGGVRVIVGTIYYIMTKMFSFKKKS